MRILANHTMHRLGASLSAQLQLGSDWRLAPTADGGRWASTSEMGPVGHEPQRPARRRSFRLDWPSQAGDFVAQSEAR
jgi:hypothetical protein